MVSRLKGEKESYRVQVKKLLQVIKQSKKASHNGLSPSSVGEPSVQAKNIMDLSEFLRQVQTCPQTLAELPECGSICLTGSSPPDGVHDDATCRQLYQSLAPGPRGSRASTLTTYVSTTPDDLSPADPYVTVDHSVKTPSLKSPCLCTSCSSGVNDPLIVFENISSAPEETTSDNNTVEMTDFPKVVSTCPNGRQQNIGCLLHEDNKIPEDAEEECDKMLDCKVKHSKSCDAIVEKQSASEKLNFIIYI